MIIQALSAMNREQLFSVFNEAFQDYERSWTSKEFDAMLNRRGFAPQLSFGAFDGPKLVSFTLNGIGPHEGLLTAYDTGTGTLKAYRGKGLATTIFKASLPYLKQAGVQQYLLEVLQSNTRAISVYTRIGFSVSRSLNYFITDSPDLHYSTGSILPDLSLCTVDLNRADEMAACCDFTPSWQNSFAAIRRNPAGFKMIGAFVQEQFIGYGIIECASGDIPQIAVQKPFRRKGAGKAIFSELIKHTGSRQLKVINTDTRHDNITKFLSSFKITVSGQQLEMTKTIV